MTEIDDSGSELTREKFDAIVSQLNANGLSPGATVYEIGPVRLSPTEQIEVWRARRWLKVARRSVERRIRKLSVPVPLAKHTPEQASQEFLKGVQLLAKARWWRDKLAAKVL